MGLGRSLYTFLNRKWFFDKVYTEFIIAPSLHHGYHTTYKMVDRGMIEILGPHGISQLLYLKASSMSRFQSGHLYHYTLMMILGLCLPIAFVLFSQYFPTTFHHMDPRLFLLFLITTIIWKLLLLAPLIPKG